MKEAPVIKLTYDKAKRFPFALTVNNKSQRYGKFDSVAWVINRIRSGEFTAAFG